MKISFDDFLGQFDPASCDGNYGGRMLLSSLADWVEWAALVASLPPWPTVVDALEDALGIDMYRGKLTGGGIDARDPEPLTEALYNVIDERRRILGTYYPFQFDGRGRFRPCPQFDFDSSAYIELLEISLLKGWFASDRAVLESCVELFEHIVAEAMRSAGCDSSIVGTSVQAGGFEKRLEKIAEELSIPVDSSAAVHSKAAKDDRVDVVAGRFFRDGRKGEVFILAQATCAEDRKWESKLSNIPLFRWRSYFLEQFPPIGFLAVPYQLSDENAALLTNLDGNRSFLDRTRLVIMLDGVIGLSSEGGKCLTGEIEKLSEKYLRLPPR